MKRDRRGSARRRAEELYDQLGDDPTCQVIAKALAAEGIHVDESTVRHWRAKDKWVDGGMNRALKWMASAATTADLPLEAIEESYLSSLHAITELTEKFRVRAEALSPYEMSLSSFLRLMKTLPPMLIQMAELRRFIVEHRGAKTSGRDA